MDHRKKKTRSAFAIFTVTVCDGLIPAWHDEHGYPVTYKTERDAQREIADTMICQLNQFLANERDFDDAIQNQDFVLPVYLLPDGSILTETGQRFDRIDK